MNVTPGTYRHYKQKDYEVIGTAIHTETREELVVYRPLYDVPELGDNPLFVRPLKQFVEQVDVDGIKKPRFERVIS